MFRKLLILLFVLLLGRSFAQSWPLEHDYPLEWYGGVRYQKVPDSLVKVYLPKGNPTLEEVMSRKDLFQDSPEVLKLQNGTIVWAKLEVKNTETEAMRFLFESDFNYRHWSTIDVYIIASDSVLRHIVTGSEIRPKDKAIRDRRNLFWLELEANEHRQLFVRFMANDEIQRTGLNFRLLEFASLQDFEGYTFRSFDRGPLKSRFQLAHNRIFNSLEYIIDSTQNFSFEQIKEKWDDYARFYRSVDYYPSRRHTFWCRFKIINVDNVPKYYLFDPSADDPKFEVYLPIVNDEYRKVLVGKEVSMNEKPFPSPFDLVGYTVPAKDTAHIYVKYQPLGHNKIFMYNALDSGVMFADSGEFLGITRISGLWKGFIMGILIFQLLYFLLRSLLQKEVLGLYYALIVFGFSLVFIYLENFGHTFYAFQLFFEDSDIVIFLAFIVLPLGLYAFTNKYLHLKTYMPLIFKVQSILLAVIILLQIGGYIQNVINYNNFAPFHFYFDFGYYMLIAFAIFSLIYFVSSFVGHFRKIPYALTYFIAFSPFLLIALANSYQHANQGELSIFRTNLMYISFILTSVLFAIVGAKRHNEMRLKEVRADNLIKLNEAKTEFYSNITHEFRTPLTVIMGLANLIKGHAKEKELIQKNGQEVLNLIQQLLEISKAQSGALQLKLIDDNVILYLEYLIESFHPLAQEKNIDLNFHHDEEEIIMTFDREKMRFILNNLLTNAIKFTPNGGKIDVAAQSESNRLLLSVSDNGIGLSSSEAEKVFDRYYQVRKKDATQIGDGIGLALVKELVELLSGTISVKSTEKLGSTFKVRLPLRLEHNLKREDDKTQLLEQDSHLSSSSENESIALVIEDNEDVLYYIKKVLAPKYKILTARDGEAGFEIAIDTIPDIIISDIMMPKMDGYAMTEKLKSDPRTDHIPIILLTAKTAQEEKIKGLSAGADAYLTKPFNEEELKVRMDTLIERRRKLQSPFAGEKPMVKKEAKQDPFLKEVLNLMEENYNDEDFNIREFVKALPLSRMQVHRKLKALTGHSTSQFIHYFRLEKARELLDKEQLNIAETAYSCGFGDPGYFSKLFSKKYGVSPLAYRGEKVG